MLSDKLTLFVQQREKTVSILDRIADGLDKNKATGHSEQMTASKFGITGTVLAVASVPLTGGLSLLALGTGTAIGVFGAYKGIKSGIDVRKEEKNLLEETKRTLEEDESVVRKLEHFLMNMSGGFASATGIVPGTAFMLSRFLGTPTAAVANTGSIFSRFSRGIFASTKPVATGTAASTILKRGGIALAVVSVPLEVWTYIDNAKKLTEESHIAKDIRKIILDLKEDLAEKRLLLANLSQ